MKNVLVLIAGIIAIVSCIPYILDILKSKTHPNLVTWFTWTLVAAINTGAAITAGAIHTAILSGAITFCDSVILLLSTKRGVKKYTAFDFICQGIAIMGLVSWRLSGNPSLAVALSLLVVLIAALPTWRHAWVAPSEETWQGFALGGLSAAITLLSLSSITFVALGFPALTVFNCAFLVSIIIIRRRIIKVPSGRP